MKTVNLLNFLNDSKSLKALDYARCSNKLVNFLSFLPEDEQFTSIIDLGVIFLYYKTANQVYIVDGLNRLLSLSLLLHAICECYKNTSPRNDKAIKTIRRKYLLDGTKTKLRLPDDEQIIYDKIIFSERLSGKEKQNHIFVLLHELWAQIKEDKLQASNIFKMLQKINITIVETENVNVRSLYYSLNKNRDELNQFKLIENYLNSYGIKKECTDLYDIYNGVLADIYLFFKDFFVTKFNFKEFDKNRLYEMFVNYFETMLQYQQPKVVISNVIKAARLYNDLLNVKFNDKKIRDAFISIKMNNGEDTFSYILDTYEDYTDGNISKETFIEILAAINEYLANRKETPNEVSFNELINYLNTFISYK